MVEISNSDLDFEVSGYVSLPELTRANRNYITILINGRYIKNFLLNRAIFDVSSLVRFSSMRFNFDLFL